MKGKIRLLAGVALAALAGASPALAADDMPTLEQRVDSLEGKVSATTISGRMYWDVTNISQSWDGQSNTAASGRNTNGVGFDAKRFYVSVDHTFSKLFQADFTTDFNYSSSTKETQLFVKKAYLQVNINPAFVLRIGATDLPWIPFNEGLYGYRYLENVLEEHAGFGTSSDWGVHALGNIGPSNLFQYQISVVNGGGYKDLERSKGVDVEGRVNVNYMGFTLGLGGRTGHLNADVQGTTTHHAATRFDAIASYSGMGARVGIQYFEANNFSSSLVTAVSGDKADGYSGWGSYFFTPEWGVFARYDYVKPSKDLHPDLVSKYFNVGVTWHPIRIVDFSLAYKHESVDNGYWKTSNGTIGGLVNTPGHSGNYDEVGIWGDFQW